MIFIIAGILNPYLFSGQICILHWPGDDVLGGILGQSEAAVTGRELRSSSKDKTSAKWCYLLVLETIFGLPILEFLRILASFGGQRIFHNSPVPSITSQVSARCIFVRKTDMDLKCMLLPSISNKSRKFMLPLELGRRNALYVPCLCLWLLWVVFLGFPFWTSNQIWHWFVSEIVYQFQRLL